MNRTVKPGSSPVITLVVNRDMALAFLVNAVLLTVLGSAIVGAATGHGIAEIESYVIASVTSGSVLLQWAAVYLATMVLHEIVHGLFMRLFGAHLKFGAGVFARFMPYFYVVSPGYAFSLTELMCVGLAPFVLISIASLAGMLMAPPTLVPLLAVAFIANFSGAAGDLWFVRFLWRFRRCSDVAIVDEAKDRMSIYTPDPLGGEIASRLQPGSSRIARFLLIWIATVFAAYLAFPILVPRVFSRLMQSDVKELVIGPDAFPLLSYVTTSTDVTFYANFAPIVLLALLLPLLDLLWRLRARPTRNAKPPQPSTHDGAHRPAFI